MRKIFTTFIVTALLTVGIGVHSTNAQTSYPYFPENEVAADLSAVATELTDPSGALVDLTGDFTIQVSATAGVEIVISNSIIYYAYTPVNTGNVRFVKKNELVFVYEDVTYMGTISHQVSNFNFPEITDETVTTSELQILSNASFETTGGLVDGSTSNYKFGEPWLTNVEIPASFGIRLATSADAVNGEYVVIWRGSGNTDYFAQPVSGIQANTPYQIIVRQIAGANANANFMVGLGSTENGLEMTNALVRLGSGENVAQSAVVTTPMELSNDVFFTFKNTPNNTASSGSDPLTQIDYISLVEGTSETSAGISGASGSVYFVSEIYAPEITIDYTLGDSYDLITYLINPSFETSNFNGWVNNGLQTQNNNGPAEQGWSKDGTYFAERWTQAPGTLPASSITQTISDIPNGVYKLMAGGHAIMQGSPDPTTGAYIFAGSEQTPINTGGEYEVTDIVVVNNSLSFGFKLEGTITANWAAVDNFRLHFFGVDLSAVNAILLEKVDEAQAIIDDNESPFGFNKSELEAAIDNAAAVEQTEASLEAAINQLTAAINHFYQIIVAYDNLKIVLETAETLANTDSPGKPEFDAAVTVALDLYESNDDKSAQDLNEAASALSVSMHTYVRSQLAPADFTALFANPNFDNAPITFTESDGAANGTALIGSRVYDIPGWTEVLGGDWGRIATASYGITFDQIPDVLNGTTPPATNKAGTTDGAALKLSGSWGSTAVLTQDITLPAGHYEFSFDVINRSPELSVQVNRFGFVPDNGDATYGTTVLFSEEWTTETVTFYLETETSGKISVGIEGMGGGAGANGKIYVDNISLTYLGDPVTVTFESNGGTEIDEVTIEKGELVEEPATPTKDGYVLEGWYADEDLTMAWDFNSPVTEDLTLYAKWADITAIADLSDLSVNGVTIEGFDAAVLDYEVILSTGTVDVPTVTATAAIENATMVINAATELPGATTVVVTALDGTTELTYTINFSVYVANNLDDHYKDAIKVYPSISNGDFTVETEGAESKVTVLDITGRTISVHKGHSVQTIQIDRAGLYLLKIESANATKVVKVIKKN